jgi:cytochrome c553
MTCDECNRYFMQCHASGSPFHHQMSAFWICVACHELAHNGESSHNARHGRLMTDLIVKYLAAFAPQL